MHYEPLLNAPLLLAVRQIEQHVLESFAETALSIDGRAQFCKSTRVVLADIHTSVLVQLSHLPAMPAIASVIPCSARNARPFG